jgi:hypothetical protein
MLRFLLLYVASQFHLVHSDFIFTSPAANATLIGGVWFNITFIESGIIPLISDLIGNEIIFYTGENVYPVSKILARSSRAVLMKTFKIPFDNFPNLTISSPANVTTMLEQQGATANGTNEL